MEQFLEPRKKKLIVSTDYELIPDDHKHNKIISNNQDNNIDNWQQSDKTKIIKVNETKINDPYNLPEKVDKYKYATVNKNDLDQFFLGFVDNAPIKNKQIDNVYKYGNPTPEQFRISNWQTEQGTSNSLNQKIMGIETNENIEDIKESQNIADKKIDENFQGEIDKIMKELNEKNKTIDNKIESNKKRLPQRAAGRQNERLMKTKQTLNEEATEKMGELNKDKTFVKKHIKEKVNIKPIIDELIKKSSKTNKKNNDDETFTQENPMNKDKKKVSPKNKEKNNTNDQTQTPKKNKKQNDDDIKARNLNEEFNEETYIDNKKRKRNDKQESNINKKRSNDESNDETYINNKKRKRNDTPEINIRKKRRLN